MTVRYVVWKKDGYWYCADVLLMQTECSEIKDFLSPLQQSMPMLTAEGGAEFY